MRNFKILELLPIQLSKIHSGWLQFSPTGPIEPILADGSSGSESKTFLPTIPLAWHKQSVLFWGKNRLVLISTVLTCEVGEAISIIPSVSPLASRSNCSTIRPVFKPQFSLSMFPPKVLTFSPLSFTPFRLTSFLKGLSYLLSF